MMDDLDKLIEAVEAGEAGWNRLATIAEEAMLPREAALSATAYSGSLDAALRLHDALLPGWEWRLGPSNAKVYPYNGHPGESWGGMSDKPARAWLTAILSAVKAQRSPGGGA